MLERMVMENFKSFYGRHEVVFGPDLNCITGANGSGKSNILEAICFAFGESSCARLRVSSLKELHSKAPSGQPNQVTTTRVTLFIRTRQNASMAISVALCGKSGHRSFRLNNKVMPIKNVKRHLRLECGINVDISLWLIQQNLVEKMPTRTPAELAAFLCEVRLHAGNLVMQADKQWFSLKAAGTKIFFDYREEALKEMEKFRVSSQHIAENIRQLSAIVQRELSVIKLYREQRELDQEMQALKTKINQLKRSLTIAYLDEAKRSLDCVEKSCKEYHAQTSILRSERDDIDKKIRALRPNLSDIAECQLHYDQAQLELVRVGTVREETSSMITKLNGKITADISKLSGIKTAIKNLVIERRSHEEGLAEALAHKSCVAILRKMYASAKMHNKTVSQVSAELCQRMEELGCEDDAQAQFRVQANAEKVKEERAQLYTLQQSEAVVAAELDSKRQALYSQHCRLRAECQGWTERSIEDEIITLRRKAQKDNEDLRRILSKLPKCHASTEVDGDYGILMNLVEVRDLTQQKAKRWIGPLGVLLQKSLSNRICADTTIAKRIIAVNANRHSFVIWPLESMVVPPRKLDGVFSAICQAFGEDNVADPLDLVTVSSGVPDKLRDSVLLCLRKALGTWLLVKSDEIGGRILHDFGIPCVSTNLNMHSRGLLAGGHHFETTVFEAFTRLPTMRSRCLKIEEQLSRMQSLQVKMTVLAETEIGMERLQATISEHEECIKRSEARIRELDNTLELCEQERQVLRNTSTGRCVLRKGLERYQEMVVCEQKLIDPDERLRDEDIEINRAMHHINVIDTEIMSLESDSAQITEDINAAKTRVSGLEQSHLLVEEEWQKMRDEVGTLANRLKQQEGTREKINEMEASHSTLSERLKALEERITQLNVEKANLVEQVQSIESTFCVIANDGCDVDMESGNHTAEQIRKRLDDFQSRLGSCDLRRKIIFEELKSAPRIVEENTLFKQSKLARFEAQAQQVEVALSHLVEGINSTELRSQYANEVTHRCVDRCLGDIFSRLVPSKSAVLTPVDTSKLEMGVCLSVYGKTTTSDRISKATRTGELSGGQLAMLGMAYVFALAHHSASPLYVLDEVDAALDEHNQRLVAELVVEYFKRSQVICISHHKAFHQKAAHLIEVQKVDGASQIKTRSARKR